METFNICWLAVLKEANKNGASFEKKSFKEFGTCSNFDFAPSRLEYLYRHGALMINLVAQSILKSSQKLPEILEIFNGLISKQNCEIFSLSNGPGIEVVGFVYGFKKYVNAFKNVSVCIATKCKEWKDVSETLITGTFHSSYIEVIGDIAFCNPRNFHFLTYEMTALSSEVRQNVQHCDVLLMYKSYEFAPDINLFKAVLMEIFSLMKKDALLFFFDGKTRMKLFESLAGCGKVVFGPQKIRVKDIPCNASIIKIVGVRPIQEGNVRFALWQKTVPVNVQKQVCETSVNNNLEKCSHTSPFSINAVDYLSMGCGSIIDSSQNLNSCKSVSNEHVPQNKLTSKTIKEAHWQNFLSNEESESDKSRTMSEISISSTHSTNQKLLKIDSSTDPIILHRVNKEDPDCKKSFKTSKLACIKDLNYQEETMDKPKLDAMIEQCEKIISDLENSIEELNTKASPSENVYENCCNHYRNVPHNCYCLSHLHMPCSLLQCCNHSCHHLTSHNELGKCYCAQRTAISSQNNMPYLLIPLGNEALFTDTVSKLLNRN